MTISPPPPPLSARTHAFCFDLDGTLVDIAVLPEAVRAEPGLVADLEALSHLTGGAVAIVTGRRLAFVDALLSPLRLPGAGVHGLELRGPDGVIRPSAWGASGDLSRLRQLAEVWVAQQDGLLLEDKGVSLALHYRLRPDLAAAVAGFAESLAATGSGDLTVQYGKMVVEVRLAGPNKGDAVAWLMTFDAFAQRVPVFFGDDVTDEVAFASVQTAGGLGVFCGAFPRATVAKARVEAPEAVRALVARLARGETVALAHEAPVSAGEVA